MDVNKWKVLLYLFPVNLALQDDIIQDNPTCVQKAVCYILVLPIHVYSPQHSIVHNCYTPNYDGLASCLELECAVTQSSMGNFQNGWMDIKLQHLS